MQMSNDEIVRNYREAKDKAKQLGILTELNACDEQKIKDILTEGGIDHRSFPRSKREKKATAPAADNKPAKAKQAVTEKMIQVQESMDQNAADLSELNAFLKRFA